MAHSLSSWRAWYEQLRPFKCLQMFSCLFPVTSGEFLAFYGATFRHVGLQAVNCCSELIWLVLKSRSAHGGIHSLFGCF